MKTVETHVVRTKIVTACTCDKCGETHKVGSAAFDEMIHIKKNCGIGSIFGDMNEVEIDICERCFAEAFDRSIRVIAPD